MSALVFDIEANGLLESKDLIPGLSTVWCIVTQDTTTKETNSYGPNEIDKGVNALADADTLIGHNIINYDMPALKRVTGFVPKDTKLIDTLVWSRVLNPDRKLPIGCPTHCASLVYDTKIVLKDELGAEYHPMKGRKNIIGPHSLAAWGWLLGREKPEHTDWWHYTPEMLHRCEVDVKINTATLFALLQEAGLSLDDLLSWKEFDTSIEVVA